MNSNDCIECNGKSWKYVCSNCGGEIDFYFDHNTGDGYESCPRCEKLGENYELKQIDCPICQRHEKVSNLDYEGITLNKLIDALVIKLSIYYGKQKVDEIHKKVIGSTHVQKTINNLIFYKNLPNIKGIHGVLGSSFYFSLGKKYKLLIGGLYFIQIWNDRCNIGHCISSEEDVIKFCEQYIDETSKLL